MLNGTPMFARGKEKAGLTPDNMSRGQVTILVLLSIVFFFILCLTTNTHIKLLAMLGALAAGATFALRVPDIRERFSLPLIFITLWVVMEGISTLYAVSGKFAIYEFTKVLLSFGIFISILSYETENEETKGRKVATVLEGAMAFAGLVSIDLISTRTIGNAFLAVIGCFTDTYQGLNWVEAGTRMLSIFNNPNVFAGCAGIAVLLSLGLATTATSYNARRFHVVCLAINALSFLLVFSMGASAMIGVAFLVYLAVEQKKRRADLIVLMVETLILSVAAMFPIFITSFGEWTGIQPVPLICVIVVAVALCVLDEVSSTKLVPLLQQHTKAVIALIVGVLVLVAVYAAIALNWTGGITLNAGEGVRRSAYPAGGSYTLQVESSGDVSVVIESQNKEDTMMHTSTVIYSGAAQDATFTVPEDSIVVYFNFSTVEGTELASATYQGQAGQEEIKLGYKILPGFVANRLQGLFANQNAIQRVVFFEDGIKLFERSPIYGLGKGAFENAITSVQSFHYETKYAHNHYIQVLLETGVLGFVFFVGSLLTMLVALILNRRRGEDANPLTPVLLATLIFMAGHAGVEVVFSSNFYLPLAFTVFALICLCCGQELTILNSQEIVKTCIQRGVAVLVGVYVLLLGGNMCAQYMFQNAATYDAIEDCIMVDRFEWADYMLSYVYSASAEERPNYEMEQNLVKYMAKLEQQDSNTIPLYLAQAYFNLDDSANAFRMLEKYVNYVPSDPETWNSAFGTLMQNSSNDEEFLAGLANIYGMMKQWESENMGTITLDPMINGYITAMLGEEAVTTTP